MTPVQFRRVVENASASMVPVDGEEMLSPRQAAAIEKKRRARARSSQLDYTRYTLPRFQDNWHFERIGEALDGVISGKILRLMIFMPPRHGKSEFASVRFPARYLGAHPQNQVILSSYADTLARTFSRATKMTISGPRHQALWPSNFEVEGDVQWQLAGKENGRPSFIAAGVGGGISGQGANLLIIDDPVKNAEEADSIVMRDKTESWYNSTARSRLQPDAAIVIIMTRWHQDDLAGRLLRKMKEDPNADQWTVLELPATNLEGEAPKEKPYAALWPANYSAEVLAKTRVSVGPRVWQSLYQQKPSAQEGEIIKREWIRFYIRPDSPIPEGCKGIRVLPRAFDQQVQSWDCAFKEKASSDYVCGTVWGRARADMFLLDRMKDRMGLAKTIHAIRAMTEKWPETDWKYVEDKANGSAVIELLRSEISGLIPVEPDGGKISRMEAAAPPFASGNVYFPHPSIAPWVHDTIEELCSFPNGLHDDEADSISQAINKMKRNSGGMYAYAQEKVDERMDKSAQLQMAELGLNARDYQPGAPATGLMGMITG